ncbi:helix-turn-helix domain-containing protein [Aggregicoccus sp. 17bor-14]|uniref:citrate synthase n=1 Tax=Myxococcaceae TaxID=31 RepID=UPI00129CFE3A|nr:MULTISPECIES: citrate synthase [Myxococcaceae]MBF5042171.1 helix-turn-helix domain-containing protein [Simulacricoccus sp. 17bor-14]MRI87948.1 helix-turn-helix domain-containing protein [Aggregicoccus sp. 17bor-14]
MAKDDGDAELSSAEAAALLDVKLPTLYAYVSRGLLHSIPSPDTKKRRYRREDVVRLKARHDARSGHGPVAASALRWGEPVLDSAITSVSGGRLRYRGHDAVELATGGTHFEALAELLWTGALPAEPPAWSAPGLGLPGAVLASLVGNAPAPVSVLQVLVPALGARDADRFLATPEAELPRARVLLLRMAAALALPASPSRAQAALQAPSVAHAAVVALGARPTPGAVRLVDLALGLFADHELNASTFTARVAASTGTDLYACIAAALASVSGPRHGASCDRVEALLAEVGRPERAASTLQARARRGDAHFAFGHLLYPAGDPRTQPLVQAALALAPKLPALRTLEAVIQVGEQATGQRAAADFGLVAAALAAGLPPGSATALFALGRTAGWVAHVLEQRAAGFLLRPRARYVGP